jgi:hypothetical protein
MKQGEFLHLLDTAASEGLFPYPQHDRMDYGGMRLHLYKSTSDFALLFEMMMFDHEAHRIERFHGFTNHAFLFRANGESIVWDDRLLPAPITRVPGTPSVSLTEDNDEHIGTRKDRQRLNPAATVIAIRRKQVAVPQDAAMYRARGIEPSDPIALPDLLRYLLATHRDELFSTETARKKVLGNAGKMRKLLTLDAWRHYTLDDRAPSRTEAMRMLADVLVTGDVSRYAPTEAPNTVTARSRSVATRHCSTSTTSRSM